MSHGHSGHHRSGHDHSGHNHSGRKRRHRRRREGNGHFSPYRLYLNRRRAKVKGVCAGIADYFGISALPIRILAVVGLFMAPAPTLLGYFAAVFLLEDRPEDLYDSPEEEKFWQHVRTEPSGTARDLRHKFRDIEGRLRGIEAHVTSSEFELNRQIRDLE